MKIWTLAAFILLSDKRNKIERSIHHSLFMYITDQILSKITTQNLGDVNDEILVNKIADTCLLFATKHHSKTIFSISV